MNDVTPKAWQENRRRAADSTSNGFLQRHRYRRCFRRIPIEACRSISFSDEIRRISCSGCRRFSEITRRRSARTNTFTNSMAAQTDSFFDGNSPMMDLASSPTKIIHLKFRLCRRIYWKLTCGKTRTSRSEGSHHTVGNSFGPTGPDRINFSVSDLINPKTATHSKLVLSIYENTNENPSRLPVHLCPLYRQSPGRRGPHDDD